MEIRMDQWVTFRKIISALSLTGFLILGGCLPQKTIIALPEPPKIYESQEIVPTNKFPSEEEIKIERLIRLLEETEQRLLETQRKTEKTLKRVEKSSQQTEEAAERIQKAQEKIEVIGQKANP
jgi:esterase/lipase